jgi:hypothetical protein
MTDVQSRTEAIQKLIPVLVIEPDVKLSFGVWTFGINKKLHQEESGRSKTLIHSGRNFIKKRVNFDKKRRRNGFWSIDYWTHFLCLDCSGSPMHKNRRDFSRNWRKYNGRSLPTEELNV